MDPTLIVMAIQAAVRLAQAGSQAFGQYARDREVLLPLVQPAIIPLRNEVRARVELAIAGNPHYLKDNGLEAAWDSFNDNGAHLPGDFDLLFGAYTRICAASDDKLQDHADQAAGAWMITQWGKQGPTGPISRVVLALAEVAVQFAAQDPSLFGVNGKAQPLVQALAQNLAALLPDNADDLGPKNELGGRLATIFLKAGLKALGEHPDALIGDQHFHLLVKNTLPQIVDKLPTDLQAQFTWRGALDNLLGPFAEAAVGVIAKNPDAYLGKSLDNDHPLGALTRIFLLKIADQGLDTTLSRQGAVNLYRSALGLLQARPGMFLGDPGGTSDRLVTALLQDVARTLQACSPPFDERTVTALASSTVDTLAQEAGPLLDPAQPWQNVIGLTLSPVLAALKDALGAGGTGALQRLVSGPQLMQFVRIVLAQATKTPGMVGTANEELKALVAAVAGAMAADRSLLLSETDWLEVAEAAAQEAASNPARLFKLNDGNGTTNVAALLLQGLVDVATTQWSQLGRAGGSVLFGSELREALVETLLAASGNAKSALSNAAAIKKFAQDLAMVVGANAGQYGSREWLRLYSALLPRVLETGNPGPLDVATLERILKGTTP